ncbi:hypothetical protein NB717_002699 [Xanthomonas sacchari]|nr:hypothetical protein [Xanthomonas sacchari]
MPFMVVTTWPTTWPPCEATAAAPVASWLAWRACSAFCLTVEVSSSIEAAVSSRLAACCSVRRDRSSLPAASSVVAPWMLRAAVWMRPTMSASWSAVVLASSRIRANTPWKSPCMRALRSPAAMACSRVDSLPRLRSLTSIIALRSCTISRKSCWNRPASPRTLKSPAAAAAARRLISVLIASRLALAASIDSCSTARLPGRRRASRRRSPLAYSLSTAMASTIASRCSNIMRLMLAARSPYTPGKSSGMRWDMSLSACSTAICAVSLEKRSSIRIISPVARSISPVSSRPGLSMRTLRSPRDTARIASRLRDTGRSTELPINQLMPKVSSTRMPPARVITPVKTSACACTSSMYTPVPITQCQGANAAL